MNISEENKKIIVDEIRLAIDFMNKNDSTDQLVYFFSAIPAMIQRIFNIEYDSDLVFAYVILKNVQDNLGAKVFNPPQGSVETLCEKHFKRLIEISTEFCDKIENDLSISEVLKKFAVLVYSINGNGAYLVQKGMLEI